MKDLTQTEESRFKELEGVVYRGQQEFIEVGNALAEIRDSKLYRQAYSTFEAYCKDRWGWSRFTALNHIKAAGIAKNVDNCQQKPTSESQVRPLRRLDPGQQKEAWERAQEIAAEEDREVTARHVEEAVNQVAPKPKREPRLVIGKGMDCAMKAINWLDDIPNNDPEFNQGLTHVINYCNERLGK